MPFTIAADNFRFHQELRKGVAGKRVLITGAGKDLGLGQASLTDQERGLVMMMSSGHSVAEMAVLLGVSPLAVENLKRRVHAKLGVNSGTQAVARAASLGMLDQNAPRPPRRPSPGYRSWHRAWTAMSACWAPPTRATFRSATRSPWRA